MHTHQKLVFFISFFAKHDNILRCFDIFLSFPEFPFGVSQTWCWITRVRLTCVASVHQAWISCDSLAHTAPSASRAHCGTDPTSRLSHSLQTHQYTKFTPATHTHTHTCTVDNKEDYGSSPRMPSQIILYTNVFRKEEIVMSSSILKEICSS